jgi:hypothetical protein
MRILSIPRGVGAALMAAAAILAVPAGVGAQEPAGPTFEQRGLLSEGTNGLDFSVDPDGTAAGIYFNGLENSLDGTGAPMFASRTFSIAVPLAGARRGAKIAVYLQGYIFRTEETDASLITVVNGRPYAMDFAKLSAEPGEQLESEECSAPWTAQMAQEVKEWEEQDNKDSFAAKSPAGRKKLDDAANPSANAPETVNDSAFLQCILADVTSASELRLNVILTMHRQDKDASGYLNVSTIDLNLRPGRR